MHSPDHRPWGSCAGSYLRGGHDFLRRRAVGSAVDHSRLMGARYPYYVLADSREGQLKEAEVSRAEPSTTSARGDIRQGFVYERVPHITLKSIANDAEIDVIWEKYQERLEPLRQRLNA